jgi:hypothetical protein
MLPAVALASVAALFSREVGARRKRKKKRRRSSLSPPPTAPPPVPPPLPPLCERCPKLCETPHVVLCKPRTETERCACTWTTTGKAVCVNTVTMISDTNKCKTSDECTRDADCGAGQACIVVDDKNCCPAGRAGNLCFPLCTV